MFMELDSINLTLEKLPRTQILNKSKNNNNNKKQLDNDKAMKKTCIFRKKINAAFLFLCIWYHEIDLPVRAYLREGLSVGICKC